MEIRIDITGLDGELDQLSGSLPESKLEAANEEAGGGMLAFVRDWYTDKGRDLFVKPGPTHGAGRTESLWAKAIPDFWSFNSDSGGFTVSLDDRGSGLRMKIEGGTISAGRARALTIPIVPEAHGLKVRDYPNDLFTIRKRDGGRPGYLFEQTQGGGIRAVYALRQSVTIKADASLLPSRDELLDSALGAFEKQVRNFYPNFSPIEDD